MKPRSKMQLFARRFLWRVKLPDLARSLLVSNGRFALMFHGVASRRYSDIPFEAQPSLDLKEFGFTMNWLKQHFHFLTPDEFFSTNNGGVLLTFDDGMANFSANAIPVLEEFNAPAVVFVATQHVSDPKDWLPATRIAVRSVWENENVPDALAQDIFDGLSEVQLIKISKHPLITIGSHTVSHPLLTKCGEQQLRDELLGSKQFLEKVTGRGIDLFAYPSGNYNRPVAEAVRTCGYRAAFVEDSNGAGFPPFEIPRIGIYSADPAYLSLKLCGLYRRAIKSAVAL